MNPLNSEKNTSYMNDPRRIAAQKELDKIVSHIQSDIKADGDAMYYTTVMPPLPEKLGTAYENLITVEAEILAGLEGQK